MLSESQKSAPVSGSEPQPQQRGTPLLAGGGPMGMILNEGMRQIDEGINKGAVAGGGAVTDFLARKGASPEVAASGGVLGNMGVRAIPSLVGALAGKLIEPVARNLPTIGSKALMQSALKPSSKEDRKSTR